MKIRDRFKIISFKVVLTRESIKDNWRAWRARRKNAKELKKQGYV